MSIRGSTPRSDDSTTPVAKLRERSLALTALAGISLLAWGYTIHLSSGMNPASFGARGDAGHAMSMATHVARPWSAHDLAFTFVMWCVMMIAMMIPAATPMILTFAATSPDSQNSLKATSSTGLFVTGYLVIWTLFSAGATLLQSLLHSVGLLATGAMAVSPRTGALLLIVAGAYQFTELKNVCLSRCRSPANFLVTEWRSGSKGAFVMGIRHGMFCVGCCWLLMLLLFAAGVMNLWWVAGIAAMVLLEKTLPAGSRLAPAIGVAAILSGVAILLNSAVQHF